MKSVIFTLRVILAWPIWFYLTHWMLVRLGADDLQMFLFWVYVPATLLASILIEVVAMEKRP